MDEKDSHKRNTVLRYLQLLDYKSVAPLSKGAFGDVLSAISRDDKKVAIKIIKNIDIWYIEEQIWPLLEHENILPVWDVMIIDELEVKLFVTPLHPVALDHMVESADFKKDPNALQRIKRWFGDILSALHYLHTAGFCHLDVKSDNVLISENDSAILCDFSGLNFTDVKLDSKDENNAAKIANKLDEIINGRL